MPQYEYIGTSLESGKLRPRTVQVTDLDAAAWLLSDTQHVTAASMRDFAIIKSGYRTRCWQSYGVEGIPSKVQSHAHLKLLLLTAYQILLSVKGCCISSRLGAQALGCHCHNHAIFPRSRAAFFPPDITRNTV